MSNEILNTTEVLDLLRIGRTTLYRWIEEGKVKQYKLAGGKKVFFKRSEVEKLFDMTEDGEEDTQDLAPAVVELERAEFEEITSFFTLAADERNMGKLVSSEQLKDRITDLLARYTAKKPRVSA